MKRALDGVIAALGRFSGEPVDLLVGEPCFDPPVEIRAAFETIAGWPASGYGPPAGLPGLREILADRSPGSRTTGENLVVTHGAKGGLLALLAALVEPGDEVIHPLPCYPAYPAMVGRFGGVPVGVAETDSGFVGWTAAVVDKMGPKTRAVVLSSPSNPSGATISRDGLAGLIGFCGDRGVRVILDEAYSAFRFDEGVDGADDLGPDDTLVRVASASKTLALCGWRIGWIVADRDLVKSVVGVQSALLNPPATPPQRAMLALPEVPAGYFTDNRDAVHGRIEAMVGATQRAGFDSAMPAGGFYLWIDIRDRLDSAAPSSAAWCERLAEEHGVGLWPGEDYGTPGWVRLALPQGENWREVVRMLEERLIAAD